MIKFRILDSVTSSMVVVAFDSNEGAAVHVVFLLEAWDSSGLSACVFSWLFWPVPLFAS